MNSLIIQSHNILQLDKVIGITNPLCATPSLLLDQCLIQPARTVWRYFVRSTLVSSISLPTRRNLPIAVIPTCCSPRSLPSSPDRLMISRPEFALIIRDVWSTGRGWSNWIDGKFLEIFSKFSHIELKFNRV